MSQKTPGALASRAKRIRAKGASATPDDAAWLAQYERDHPRVGGRRVAPADKPAGPSTSPAPAPAPSPAVAPATPAAQGLVALDFAARPPGADGAAPATPAAAAPAAPAPATPATPVCAIPNCPRCKVKGGGQRCAVTGEVVYPRMSPEGAEAMARMLLIGWSFLVIKLIRADGRAVPPNDAEARLMGRALAEIAWRRASWIGAFDDLIMFGAAMTMYTRRSLAEPDQSKVANGSSAAAPNPQT